MKSILTILLIMVVSHTLYAQKTELWLNANSGLFHFSGNGANPAIPFFYMPTLAAREYSPVLSTKSNGPGLGLSVSGQHATRYHLIYGLEAGYEHFSSKATLTDGYYLPSLFSSSLLPMSANGTSTTAFDFINIHPYIGYRIKCSKQMNIDATAGFELAYATKASGKLTAETSQAGHVEGDVNVQKPKRDFRPRLQINITYKRFGIYSGYSWGKINYMEGYVGGNPEAFARIFRFGINYRVF